MKIYFAGSISGGRQDAALYNQIILSLAKHGKVLTEHIGIAEMTMEGEDLPHKLIHDRDLDWLAQSDVIVAECTVTSLGVGYEIAKAEEWGKRILVLYREGENPLSSMIQGSDLVQYHAYKDVQEVDDILKQFFKEAQSRECLLLGL